MPRLPYAAAEQPDPEDAVAARLAARRGGRLTPLDRLLLHSPPVADGWNALLGAVRSGTSLDAADRELVICAVAVANGAGYEWATHAPLAAAAGVGAEALAALRAGDPSGLDPRQRLAVEYATAMTTDVAVPDELFARVRETWDERGVVELTATAATYNLVSRFLVALDLTEAEPHIEG